MTLPHSLAGGNPPAPPPVRPDPGTLTALRCPMCDGPVYQPAPGELTCPACASTPTPAAGGDEAIPGLACPRCGGGLRGLFRGVFLADGPYCPACPSPFAPAPDDIARPAGGEGVAGGRS